MSEIGVGSRSEEVAHQWDFGVEGGEAEGGSLVAWDTVVWILSRDQLWLSAMKSCGIQPCDFSKEGEKNRVCGLGLGKAWLPGLTPILQSTGRKRGKYWLGILHTRIKTGVEKSAHGGGGIGGSESGDDEAGGRDGEVV